MHGPGVPTEEEIRQALQAACEVRGTALAIAAAFEVSPSTVTRWRQGAAIPATMQKLLCVYLLKRWPFAEALAAARGVDLLQQV